MQADTLQLKDVLNRDRRYVIPTFQRDYEWTEDGQWTLLFDDLESVTLRLLAARQEADRMGRQRVRADQSVSPHFLGAIVCDQLATAAGGIDMRAVIDGQQRLTTLQLLLRGVLDVLIERESPRATQVRRLLQNPEDVVRNADDIYKVWPRRKDRLIWPIAMADQPISSKDYVPHLYFEARKYFADRFRDFISEQPEDIRVEITDTTVDGLMDMFKLVVIDLEENDDAQVIFEVLNGRQTPLSASDLVKNLLFLRGELADEDELEQLYESYWADFDDPWWKVEVGVGHAARGRRDILLSAWLTAHSGKEASVAHLYGSVRLHLDEISLSTQEVLSSIHNFGQAYRDIYAAGQVIPVEFAKRYERITGLKFQTAVPVLAWLRTLSENKISTDDHLVAVKAIESWLMRRTLLGLNTRGYNTAFIHVLQHAQLALLNGESISSAIISGLESAPNNMAWPSDNDVQSAILKDKIYGRISQERLRMVFGAIDTHIRESNAKTETATIDYNSLQVEHVLPQSWQEHWPFSSEGASAEEQRQLAEKRDEYVHHLGNLTLVTSSFNASVSNLAWEIKKEELIKQSSLRLTSGIVSSQVWNEYEIDRRAKELSDVFLKIWEKPLAE